MDEILPSSPEQSSSLEPPAGVVRIESRTVETCIGTIRKWSTVSALQKAFLFISLIELTVSLCYGVYVVIANTKFSDEASGEDLILAAVLIINIIFCYLYVFDGIMREKPYDIIVFIVAHGIVLIYIVENYVIRCVQHNHLCLDTVKLSRLAFSGLMSPPVIVIGAVIIHDYLNRGEFVFRIVGASASLQQACRILFAALSIILLDLQLQMSMLTLLLYVKIIAQRMGEIIVLSCDLPFAIILALGSYFAIRLESVTISILVAVFSLAEPAYNMYCMYEIFLGISTSSHELLDIIIISLGAGTILVRVIHLFLLYRCSMNFNRTLRTLVFEHDHSGERRPLLTQ